MDQFIPKSDFPEILLVDEWEEITRCADEREAQKRGYATSKLLRGTHSTHLIGLAGEFALAKLTGRKPDTSLRIQGDGGSDFKNLDVKTATYWPPILKHPVNPKYWPEWLALVYLDEENKTARFIGTVSKADLMSGEQKTFHPSAGPQHTLSCGEVRRLSRAYKEQREKARQFENLSAAGTETRQGSQSPQSPHSI